MTQPQQPPATTASPPNRSHPAAATSRHPPSPANSPASRRRRSVPEGVHLTSGERQCQCQCQCGLYTICGVISSPPVEPSRHHRDGQCVRVESSRHHLVTICGLYVISSPSVELRHLRSSVSSTSCSSASWGRRLQCYGGAALRRNINASRRLAGGAAAAEAAWGTRTLT